LRAVITTRRFGDARCLCLCHASRLFCESGCVSSREASVDQVKRNGRCTTSSISGTPGRCVQRASRAMGRGPSFVRRKCRRHTRASTPPPSLTASTQRMPATGVTSAETPARSAGAFGALIRPADDDCQRHSTAFRGAVHGGSAAFPLQFPRAHCRGACVTMRNRSCTRIRNGSMMSPVYTLCGLHGRFRPLCARWTGAAKLASAAPIPGQINCIYEANQ
jgi:hypothetical protein